MDDDKEQPATQFQRVYGLIFLTFFLAAVGGGLCVFGGQEAIAMERTTGRYSRHSDDSVFQIFRVPGLRDWRVQLVIGATIGAVSGLGYSIRHWRDKY